MNRAASIDDLTNPQWLGTIFGPVKNISIQPFTAIGYSGATLQKVELVLEDDVRKNLVLKQTNLKADWLSQRTHDTIGREAAWLKEECLAKVWSIIHCPYIAFSQENDRTGLLMEDLSDHLFPDNREPIDMESENIIIDAMAAIHAEYWDSDAVKQLTWLIHPYDYLNLLRPLEREQDSYCPPPEPLRTSMSEGWRIAFELLPDEIKNYLTQPVEEIFKRWENLPVTLLHGDMKIANMASLPGDKLSLFDWPLIGSAPCSIELGWYLAVNSTRLARSKEDFIYAYRCDLECYLQEAFDEITWQEMVKLAIVSGAMMMLWNKALKRKSGKQGESPEWEWWAKQLEIVICQ